jgi:hypothetical protein
MPERKMNLILNCLHYIIYFWKINITEISGISPQFIQNHVATYCKNEEISWLIKVINKHINDLQPAVERNMKQYALALYCYSSGRAVKPEAIGSLI